MNGILPLILGTQKGRDLLIRRSVVFYELRRFAKFIAVGTVGVGINLGALVLFTEVVGFYYLISAIFAGIITTLFNYSANNYWSFNDRKSANHIFGFSKFMVVTGVYHGIYYGLLATFAEVCNLHYIIAAVLAIGLCVPIKYAFCYMWVWKRETRLEYL